MSGIEKSNGSTIVVGARWSDTANHKDGANAIDRSRDHASDGRFAKGNRAAKGTGPKRSVRGLVPARARPMFELAIGELGPTAPTVACILMADCVRHSITAADLSELANEKGLATPEGEKLLASSQRSSELALRSSVAAMEAARLIRHPKAKTTKAKVPVGFTETE